MRGRLIAGMLTVGLLGLGEGCSSTSAPAGQGTSPSPAATSASSAPSPIPTVTLSQTPSPPASSAPARRSSPSVHPSSAPPSVPGVSPALVATTAHTGRYVALTFDDGPNPAYTPQVLALLRQYGAHATFCEIGDAAHAYPDLVREVVADGNRLCDHTMTHDEQLGTRSQSRIDWQIATDKQVLLTLGGGAPIRYYRQPGGNWTWQIQVTAA